MAELSDDHQCEWDPECTPPRRTCGCDGGAKSPKLAVVGEEEQVLSAIREASEGWEKIHSAESRPQWILAKLKEKGLLRTPEPTPPVREEELTELLRSFEDTSSKSVQHWPRDERELFRNGQWSSFEERGKMLDELRLSKRAKKIMEFFSSKH